ncbi:MAG: ATP-binding protein [Clostridia bacterium]|nr:ATP-binding protein [Clostridia bacterium]
MELSLKNVGIIGSSSLNLTGLCVITGINASGKTTAGKVLYSLFDAVENTEGKILNQKGQRARITIEQLLEEDAFREIKNSRPEGDPDALYYFLDTRVPFFVSYSQIKEYAESLAAAIRAFDFDAFKGRTKEGEQKDARKIKEVFGHALTVLGKITEDSAPEKNTTAFCRREMKDKLEREFAGQMAPLDNPGAKSKITVTSGEKVVFDVTAEGGDFDAVYNKENNDVGNIFLLDDAEDIENAGTITCVLPAAADSWLSDNKKDEIFEVLKARSVLTHSEKNRVYLSLLDNENYTGRAKPDKACEGALQKLCELIPGDFVEKDNKIFYRVNGFDLNVRNLSCGSKVLSALKILMTLGFIKKDTVLILDEPEVHLNPDWQNKYAEILTLLVAGGVRVLLTTHSPNFLLALETYSKIHGTEDKTKVYVTKKEDGATHSALKDVTDNLEEAYEILARPYMEMDELRYSLAEDDD